MDVEQLDIKINFPRKTSVFRLRHEDGKKIWYGYAYLDTKEKSIKWTDWDKFFHSLREEDQEKIEALKAIHNL